MLPAPSSTGVDTVGPPVGVVTQFEVNVAPLKSTECTVAFRLKMIVSVLLVRSSSAAAAQLVPVWVAVTAFVTLAGVALVLSVSAPFTELPLVTLTCLRVPVCALKVPVAPSCAKPATTQLLLSCVVTLTVGAVPVPEFVFVRPSAPTPEYCATAHTTSEPAERLTVTVVEAPGATFALQISVRAPAVGPFVDLSAIGGGPVGDRGHGGPRWPRRG